VFLHTSEQRPGGGKYKRCKRFRLEGVNKNN